MKPLRLRARRRGPRAKVETALNRRKRTSQTNGHPFYPNSDDNGLISVNKNRRTLFGLALCRTKQFE
jgi:hypothetical protein